MGAGSLFGNHCCPLANNVRIEVRSFSPDRNGFMLGLNAPQDIWRYWKEQVARWFTLGPDFCTVLFWYLSSDKVRDGPT